MDPQTSVHCVHGASGDYVLVMGIYPLANFLGQPTPQPQPRRIRKAKGVLNTAKERRQASYEYKKKRFEQRQADHREWKRGIRQRRLEEQARQVEKEERENLDTSFLFKKLGRDRKRKARTLACPLDTCPKKMKLRQRLALKNGHKLEDPELSLTDSDGSLLTHISKGSRRSRSPIKIKRRN